MKKEIKNKKIFFGYTLAEAICVLVVLGIVASITIPPVVRRQIEASNRTKIKKAYKVYDFLVNKITVENDIHTKTALREYGLGCQVIADTFKVKRFAKIPNSVQDNICRPEGSDGVWFDFTNLDEPIVALSEEGLDDHKNRTTFKFQTDYDANGAPRINDIEYNDVAQVIKLLNFMYGEKMTDKISRVSKGPVKGFSADCFTLYGLDGGYKSCTRTTMSYKKVSGKVYWTIGYIVYDENGKEIEEGLGCTLDKKCKEAYHAIADDNGGYHELTLDKDSDYFKYISSHPNEINDIYEKNEEYAYLTNHEMEDLLKLYNAKMSACVKIENDYTYTIDYSSTCGNGEYIKWEI